MAKLGSGEYGLALDAVGKEPVGYNRLYVDANHDAYRNAGGHRHSHRDAHGDTRAAIR